jgi:methylglutaconyl-CoA hydratase
LDNLQEGAPLAQSEIKQFIRTISSKPLNEELLNFTAETLARVKVSEEANEGINSFFEKRKPEWSVFQHTRDNEKHV